MGSERKEEAPGIGGGGDDDDDEFEGAENGPVDVVVLPSQEAYEDIGSGFGLQEEATFGKTRESATLFWKNSVETGENTTLGGYQGRRRDLNMLKGAHPNMLVQPRSASLYGPSLQFNS